MSAYKKLLVAFDGSGSSRNALVQAFSLAQREKAWIKVLAVVPSYDGDIDLSGVGDIEAVLKGPGEKLVAEARRMADEARVNVLTGVGQGEVYEKIVEVAGDERCGLIVMGRRGHHDIGRMVIGSVTARVIAHSTMDVLVFPLGTGLGWGRILLATDGSECSLAAAQRAIAFCAAYGSALSAVSVVHAPVEMYAEAPKLVERMIEKSRSILDGIAALAGRSGVKIETHVREGEPDEEVIKLATELEAEMIVMGSHGRTGIKKVIMGSVTEKVIAEAVLPGIGRKSLILSNA